MTSFVTWCRCKRSRCRTVGDRYVVSSVFLPLQVPRSRSGLRFPPVDVWSKPTLQFVALFFLLFVNMRASFATALRTPSATSEFSVEHLRIFRDPSGSASFFHTLHVDPQNEDDVYVGALDYVYKLNADNIQLQHVRSANLTDNSNYRDRYKADQAACRYIGGLLNPDIQCRNHIRTVIPLINNSGQIYVCSTGAYNPQEFILNADSLDIIKVNSASSGRAKCPYDPLSIYTYAYVASGNLHDIPLLYTAVAVDSNSGYVTIIRQQLQTQNQTTTAKLLRTDPDPRWINTAEAVYVVAAFDIGPYVFYFFRELAMESTAYCGKTYYSRVARVCKNDEGGSGLTMEFRFTSFLKARLICSQTSSTSSIPYFFNDIYDVKYNRTSETFIALFMANSNGQWGSAVCVYKLSDINDNFDRGPWIEQPKLESAWLRVSDEDVPSPRPGQCTGGSMNFITSTLSFIKSHPLMMNSVNADGGSPIFYSKDFAFNKLEIDVVGNYSVLYLYLPEAEELHRVVLWRNDVGKPAFNLISIWKPFSSLSYDASGSSVFSVWSLTFHEVKKHKWLYVTGDQAVVQLSPNQCSAYKFCSDCVRDPYCGWNGQCTTFQPAPGLLQAVESSKPLSDCGSHCAKRYKRSGVIPGMSVEMNCSSNCRPDDQLNVTWTFLNTSGGEMPTIRADGSSNYALTATGGLIILRVSAVEHAGTFRCSYKGTVLAEHTLTMSVCEFGDDVRDTFTKEYLRWCQAFDIYRNEYQRWICMKKKCMAGNCIPDARDCP